MKFFSSKEGEWIKGTGRGYTKKVIVKEVDLNSSKVRVQILRIEPNTEVGPHYHKETVEIFYFLKGKGAFIINNKSYFCEAGDVLICEPNDIHTVRNEFNNTWEYLAVKTETKEADSFWLKQ